ncbi:uncharacterized protein [Musca autumnalis]|uniref:uncharacterized protein n=1 Tax=Musca autumnalis TaxID=221902 RepID=UPI003CF39640
MSGPTLHDIEFDVAEEEVTSTPQVSCDVQTNIKNVKIANDRKRQRLEAALSPISVNASDLANKLANYNTNDQNKFGILGVLADVNLKTSQPANVTRNVTEEDTTKKATAKTWCPPIFVYNMDIIALVESLKTTIPAGSYKIKNINKSKSKLYFMDPTVHASMMAILKEKNIHSYSFTPREQRQVPLVIRGLFNRTDADKIKLELDELVPNTVDKVTKFKTPYSIKRNSDTGLYAVSLLPGKRLGDVSHIKELQGQTMYWEKPKRKERDIQCHRCQKWGHIARNCNSAFKCVKCDQEHAPGQCQRVRSEAAEVYCTNCKETGHPANYKGCPIYKKFVAARHQKVAKAIEEKNIAKANVNRAINMSQISPGKTFSSLFNTQHPQQSKQNNQRSKPTIIEEFLKLANFFLEPEEMTLEQEINLFLKRYQTMSKADAKTEFLRLLNKVKDNYGS